MVLKDAKNKSDGDKYNKNGGQMTIKNISSKNTLLMD